MRDAPPTVSPFSLAAQQRAAIQSLLDDPPPDRRGRIKLSLKFPDGSVRVEFVKPTRRGSVALGVELTELLERPGVEVHGQWVF